MNKADQIQAANRREFIRHGFRYALLTGLTVVSATLIKRRRGKLSGQTCSNQGVCSNCTAFTGCGLPQALSAKEFQLRSRRREEAQSTSPKNQSLLTSAATSKGDEA